MGFYKILYKQKTKNNYELLKTFDFWEKRFIYICRFEGLKKIV